MRDFWDGTDLSHAVGTTTKDVFFAFSFLTDELPYLKCPLHTVLKLTPVAYGKLSLKIFFIVFLVCNLAISDKCS